MAKKIYAAIVNGVEVTRSTDRTYSHAVVWTSDCGKLVEAKAFAGSQALAQKQVTKWNPVRHYTDEFLLAKSMNPADYPPLERNPAYKLVPGKIIVVPVAQKITGCLQPPIRKEGKPMEYESGIETAKKIRAALRRTFPGQTFSVRSSKYSVYVCWLEGPFVSDVEAVLHDFQSYETRSVNGEDQQEAVGYLWEGQRIVGAQYLLTNRCEVLKEADRLAKEIQKTTHVRYPCSRNKLIVS